MLKLIKNFVYNSLYQVIVLIIPIILTPYLTSHLHSEAIGINSYTVSIVTLFTTFGMLGLTLYSNREIATARTRGHDEVSRTFFSLLLIRVVLFALSIAIYLIMSFNSEYKLYFLFQIPLLAFGFLDVSWLFVGLEEIKVVSIRNCIFLIIGTVLTLFLVKTPADLGKYILINGLSQCAGILAVIPILHKYIHFISINSSDITKHFVPALKLFLPQAASSLYVLLDKAMIKWLTDNVTSVGFYDKSMSVAKIPTIIAGSIATIMLPRIAYEVEKKNLDGAREYINKALGILGRLAFPLMFGLMAIAEKFVPWFLGSEFLVCINLMRFMAVIILPISITYVTGHMYMIPFKKNKEMTISYICAAVTDIILNLILIPRIEIYGAIIGTVAAELVVLIVQYSYMVKELGGMQIISKVFRSLIASGVMAIVVIYCGRFMAASILTTVVQILIGAIVYVLMILIFRDKMVFEYAKFALQLIKDKKNARES